MNRCKINTVFWHDELEALQPNVDCIFINKVAKVQPHLKTVAIKCQKFTLARREILSKSVNAT